MQKLRQPILIAALCLFMTGSYCDAKADKPEDSEPTSYPVSASERRASVVVADAAFKWGDVRRYGAIGDGRTDDTAALQMALDSGSEQVFFPKPPAKYMTDQLLIRSDNDILLQDETIIEANPGYGRIDAVLLVRDVKNISISGYGAVIQMPKSEYSGEFNHGVAIRGSSNVEIEGLMSRNTGGDGFYVGNGRDPNTFSQDVVLRNIRADNNRRQGLSIVSVKGLHVINPRLTNTSGTNPASAIDIEPNNNGHFLEDIVIDNPYSANNDGNGYNIYLKSLPGPIDKHVSITINDAVDEKSASSFVVGKLATRGYVVDGYIRFNRPKSVESRAMAFVARNYDVNGPRVEFHNPVAIRPNTDKHRSTKYGSAMVVFREQDDTGPETLGNIHFFNPEIRDDRRVPHTRHYFHIRDLSGPPVENVTINGSITGTGLRTATDMIHFDGSGVIEDADGLLVQDTGNRNLTLQYSSYARTVTNRGSSRPVRITLGNVPDGWPSVTFEVKEPNEFTIWGAPGSSIVTSRSKGFRTASSSTVGSTITLRHLAGGEWRIVSQAGNWSFKP